VFHLQKSLGHSSLDMSRRYAAVDDEDLTAVTQRSVCWLRKHEARRQQVPNGTEFDGGLSFFL